MDKIYDNYFPNLTIWGSLLNDEKYTSSSIYAIKSKNNKGFLLLSFKLNIKFFNKKSSGYVCITETDNLDDIHVLMDSGDNAYHIYDKENLNYKYSLSVYDKDLLNMDKIKEKYYCFQSKKIVPLLSVGNVKTINIFDINYSFFVKLIENNVLLNSGNQFSANLNKIDSDLHYILFDMKFPILKVDYKNFLFHLLKNISEKYQFKDNIIEDLSAFLNETTGFHLFMFKNEDKLNNSIKLKKQLDLVSSLVSSNLNIKEYNKEKSKSNSLYVSGNNFEEIYNFTTQYYIELNKYKEYLLNQYLRYYSKYIKNIFKKETVLCDLFFDNFINFHSFVNNNRQELKSGSSYMDLISMKQSGLFKSNIKYESELMINIFEKILSSNMS